ncbi:hypothetical protein NM208_g716 [Fusarium decemcellulare]|uniref:Uncharacterized protein n=1 Tax=Fusarium decemcellulare TaxID=57161 RepID=A0ACC1SYS6_9HYPO|nr:hypothetical protein NM208_g716 [Fusarium decemcellulare]
MFLTPRSPKLRFSEASSHQLARFSHVFELENRYTEKQLEKKRRADRLGKQRLRNESKRKAAELETQLQLSLGGESAQLVRQLTEENARLRSAVDYYRSRLQVIIGCSRDCLEYNWQSTETRASTGPDISLPDSFQAEQGSGLYKEKSLDPTANCTSAYFQGGVLINMAVPFHSSDIPVNRILESVIAWKRSKNHNLGSQSLGELFSQSQSSRFSNTSDELDWRISSKLFYKYLVEALTTGKSFPVREDDRLCQLAPEQLSDVERQKRMTALCTYDMFRPWISLFASLHEWSAIFWSLFKSFQFLTFPTPETLHEIPHCLWPTPAQFLEEHLAFVDYLIWPRLRDALTQKNNQYEPEVLIRELVRNFELRKTHSALREPIFVLTADATDIKPSAAMSDIIYNLKNFQMHKNFERSYPDLAWCIARDTGVGEQDTLTGIHPAEDRPSASGNVFCSTRWDGDHQLGGYATSEFMMRPQSFNNNSGNTDSFGFSATADRLFGYTGAMMEDSGYDPAHSFNDLVQCSSYNTGCDAEADFSMGLYPFPNSIDLETLSFPRNY